ncbi:DNA/RNA helicase domain-containing protein [Lacinutrix sp. Hel_I_90]|uniref:DNA/RNA helicase domain-containing protein n=1 Tax=Lacinutrix sp. Hel_I_90 TaxID=1249999 RepID=UPI000698EB4A|nr:DNA/RNA helicase domain-containing protein [Lacinutrix sp. Hel_I_90]
MIDKQAFKIERHNFDILSIDSLDNHYANNLWPIVYLINDDKVKELYVGETTDAIKRLKSHLKNNKKNKLTTFRLISSSKFNKSAALDIESLLIKYISGDGQYKLLNLNLGIANHNYYQKSEIYWDVFKNVWDGLRREGIAKHSLSHIDNSDLFKYSPYKSLTEEQKKGLYLIVDNLLNENVHNTVIEGGAGTGKTILAIFLFKLLNSEITDFNFRDFGDDEIELKYKIDKLKQKYPKPKMALVVPMSSLRTTLKRVFKNVKGLKASMVIGPAELGKSHFDIVIVDESHRLRRRVNLGAYFGSFDKVNDKLNLDKFSGNELDWVVLQSSKAILFYDEGQSIKPSDILKEDFDKLKFKFDTKIEFLQSQFRVKGGNSYVKYVDDLLNCNLGNIQEVYKDKNYDFTLFDNIESLISEIKLRNKEVGLARMIAGYSWKWISNKDGGLLDIKIEDTQLKWNSTNIDWVNSPNAIDEVGCIHTTQGYDLNYSGIIFGEEISYSKERNEIIIIEENYYDANGKQSIRKPSELKDFIINIYKTILLRGIKGTYVYACDKDLRDYLSTYILPHESTSIMNETIHLKIENDQFENSVPFYNIHAAAGNFSELQTIDDNKWIELPEYVRFAKDYFACKVVGESMNKIIPNNSICLFKKYRGGSRNGRIVLAKSTGIQDRDFGSGYTVKEYSSTKDVNEETWSHTSIILKPKSLDDSYEQIMLDYDTLEDFEIIGVFEMVLI